MKKLTHRTGPAATAATLVAALAALAASPPAAAVDFGPFSLTGFVKAEATHVSPVCANNACQRDPLAGKDYVWSDTLVQGHTYGDDTTHVVLFQPYLGFKQALPRGFRLEALLSQRWRDGDPDFKGFWYEKNVALVHEDYGTLRIGAMTTRAWAFADYPYGSNLNVADEWGASGAGYGILTRAVRYTSRTLDLFDGDVVLEATYDAGVSGWHRNKPRFLEFWAHYGRGDFTLDAMLQDTRNGTPSAFGHGVFTAPFYNPVADPLIGGNGQSIAMAMARYQLDSRIELSGGLRANRWSGAYATFLYPAATNPLGHYDLWSNAFNVDWSHDLGGTYRGYSARSIDVLAGVRYKLDQLTFSAGLVHLGSASTANPVDRGARNSATIGAVGVNYDVGRGFQVYGFAGAVRYAHLGLSPISMPTNSAFTNVDSRLSTHGNWFGAGAVYTF